MSVDNMSLYRAILNWYWENKWADLRNPRPETRNPRLNTRKQGHGYSEGEREYVADFDNYVSDFYQRARLALDQ